MKPRFHFHVTVDLCIRNTEANVGMEKQHQSHVPMENTATVVLATRRRRGGFPSHPEPKINSSAIEWSAFSLCDKFNNARDWDFGAEN